MSAELELELPGGIWTEQAFLARPDDRRVELLDGALLMSPSPGRRHQRLSFRLCLALERARPDGVEVLEAVNVRVGPGRILIPDLAVVSSQDADATVFDAADVLAVIEIVSPGSTATDRAVKPALYAEAGIRNYVRLELRGPVAVGYELRDGRYAAGEPAAVLRLVEPFPVEVDLVALLAADRVDG